MSQFQSQGGGPFDPIAYNSGVYQPNPRPTSVTVISIISIVIGSLFLFCNALGLIGQLLMLASGGRNPFLPSAPPMNDAAVTAYGVVISVMNLLIAGAFLFAGIGGLKLWPFARRGLIALSIFVVFYATLALVVQLVWVGPRTLEYSHRIQRHFHQTTPTPMVNDFQKTAQVVVAFVGWVIWCAVPVCVLILWRSPQVISAFEGGSVPPEGMPPGATWPPASQPPAGFR